jgi:outer membrane protein OmpU
LKLILSGFAVRAQIRLRLLGRLFILGRLVSLLKPACCNANGDAELSRLPPANKEDAMKGAEKLSVFAVLLVGYTGAYAQSGVTLYGLIDEGFTMVNNVGGHQLIKVEDYNLSGNRFGFMGREDLGSGTAAIFKLENGFSLNTGALRQGGLEFGRSAWVGVTNQTYGTVTAGRQWDQTGLILGTYHPDATIGLNGATPGDADRVSGEWLNNSVTYASPNIKGAQFSLQYSLAGDGTSTTNGGAALSGGASYVNGPFSAGVAFTRINAYTFKPGATLGVSELFGLGVNPSTSFVLNRYRTVGVGASYRFNPVTIATLYTNTHFELGSDNTETLQTLGLSAIYQITPQLSSSLGFLHSKMAGSTWNIYSGIVDYSLSKRTDIYASADFEKVGGPNVVAQLALESPSSNGSQLAMRIALRTRF